MKNYIRYIIFAISIIVVAILTIFGSIYFIHSLDKKPDKKFEIPEGKQLIDAKWNESAEIDDCYPGSFKEFILHNNTPVLLNDLYKNLDSESKRILDMTLLKILNIPDKKYADYYLMDDAFFDKFKSEKELEYKKYTKEHFHDMYHQYKFVEGYVPYPRLFLSKLNLIDANQKTLDYIKNKIVIDGGAYMGDTALVISEFSPSKIYSFEISRNNVDAYKKTMKLNNVPDDLYEINRVAISDKKGTYKISSERQCGGIFEGNGEVKDDTVESIDIDTFLKNKNEKRKVGFIHADIQGALLLMIDGMKNTIRKDRPILSLDISNSPQEFFYAKPKLEKIVKDLNYKIKIINYNDFIPGIMGVSIWAYPKELDE